MSATAGDGSVLSRERIVFKQSHGGGVCRAGGNVSGRWFIVFHVKLSAAAGDGSVLSSERDVRGGSHDCGVCFDRRFVSGQQQHVCDGELSAAASADGDVLSSDGIVY